MSPANPHPRGRRILVALPTMFAADGSLDLEASARAAHLVRSSQADGAFIAGTTGEFLSLEPDERLALFATQREALGGKRIIGHIGAGSTRQAIALMEAALSRGVTEFAALTPYYLPASPPATYRHFAALAEAAAGRARIYAYLFRARTSTQVSPAELGRIAELPGIVGVKVSGEDLATVVEYRAATPAEFEVFTGNDADFPRLGAHGLDGVVSGVAACFPATFDRMVAALATGDEAAIATAQADVLAAVDLIDGDIGRIKTGLGALGIGGPTVRMAIEAPDVALAETIGATVAKLEHR
ncbi:MAG: dihydrodipicolinate synthase family protein [Propioniciclava sp.]